jgi:hypothetical protein
MRLIIFRYTGIATIEGKSDEIPEIIAASDIFGCEELKQICNNIINDEDYYNPSIGILINQSIKFSDIFQGTWMNDQTGGMFKELFLNKSKFSDVSFKVDGKTIYAHRIILSSRCSFMSTMFAGSFIESKRNAEIPIPFASLECFLAVLGYKNSSLNI